MTLITFFMAGSKKFATSELKYNQIFFKKFIDRMVNAYPLSLMLPDRISYCGSFSLRPKRTKYGFEDPLKLGFVVLSKYLLITSTSLGIPNFDPWSFSTKSYRS